MEAVPQVRWPLVVRFGDEPPETRLPSRNSSAYQASTTKITMSQYIDGFILSVPKDKLAAYKRLATKAGKIWRELGALEYRECVGDDLDAKGMVPFPKLAKSKPDEVVIFAYAVFESRKQRDAVNKKIMADPRIQAICSASGGLFDYKRMAYGGFKTLVCA